MFERTVPLKLTYAGEIYIDSAKKILSIEGEMLEKIADIQGGKMGKIYLGVGFLNSATLVPNIVNMYRQQFPDVEIIVDEDMEPNLKIKADSGELDLIFATSKFEDLQYERVELFQEDFLVAVPRGMSIGSSGQKTDVIETIDVNKVKDIPFIMLKSNTYIRQIVEESFSRVGIKPKCAAVCTSAIGAYGMVKAGAGATLIPYSTYLNDYSPNIEYYRFADNNYKRTVSLYYNRNRYIPHIIKEFISVSKEYFNANYYN